MNKILIIGYGVVGRNLAKELSVLQPHIYDKYKTEYNTKENIKYDFAFVCVDTPGPSCDITEVRNAIKDNNADIYIIKSAVLPGTQELLSKELNKHIIISPEYYGATQHCNNFEFSFTILGGKKDHCLKVQQLLQYVYDARHTFHIVEPKVAELTKYMENSWIATKVVFCNQFKQMSDQLNINYEDVRELFILDPRVNPSHTFVYNDKPYYDSHCLNKDIPAIAEYMNNDFLKFIIECNKKSST